MTTQELLAERWRSATRDVRRFAGEGGMSTVNSDRWERIDDTLEEIASWLVEEYSDRWEGEDPDIEMRAALLEPIWADIEARMLAWADLVLAKRADRRKGAAV